MNSVVLAVLVTAVNVESMGVSLTGFGSATNEPVTPQFGAGAHLLGELRVGFGDVFLEARTSLLLQTPGTADIFQDLGSSLAVGYRPHSFVEEVRLTLWPATSVTALPVFDWVNVLNDRVIIAPAASIQVATRAFTIWSTLRFKSDRLLGVMSLPDIIAGLTVRTAPVHLEAHFARFLFGVGLRQAPLDAVVGSARLSWTWREYVGPTLDLDRYADDPWRFERFFIPEPRASPTALWLALEGGGGHQTVFAGGGVVALETQSLGWLDAQLRVRVHELRLFLTGRVQTASFARASEAASNRLWDPAPSMEGTAMLALLLGADVTWAAAKLTLGVLFTLDRPAWFRAGGPYAYDSGSVYQTSSYLVLSPRMLGALPYDAEVAPRFGTKFSLRWDPLPYLTFAGEVNVVKDWNMWAPMSSNLKSGPSRVLVRGQLLVQARF